MSTISSPRLSIASSRAHSPTPTSSRRPSIDALIAPSPNTRSVSPSVHPRRNRAALRDYYNLKPPTPVDAANGGAGGPYRSRSVPRSASDVASVTIIASPSVATVGAAELDNPDFDAQKYVDDLLARSSLATILKAENTLIGDIRTLDGERKALVYDNYSKLIRAVEMIGKMRRSMDELGAPLTMAKILGPAIAFVAETAGSLIREGEEQGRRINEAKARGDDRGRKQAEKDTVRWVLAAPKRLRKLVGDGNREEAEKDWAEVGRLLRKWRGVRGVSEIREACEKVMKDQEKE